MKRQLPLIFAMLCATAFATMVANFTSVSAEIVGDSLNVSFSESGMKPGTTNFTATAKGSAVYGCVNQGGNSAPGLNKRMLLDANVIGRKSYTAKGTFVNGVVTIPPPIARSIQCPPGQTLVLSSVAYTGIQVNDTTNNVAMPVHGLFMKVLRQLE
jgi:hypothetical protein